jgi:cbb3-type cytochrome oxidase subunit 3
VAIVLWALRKPKAEIEEMERLPLEDEGVKIKENVND